METMKAGRSFVCAGIACIALLPLAEGCDSQVDGSVGAYCAKDLDCHDGLVCLSQICVAAPVTANGGNGGNGGNSGGNGGSGGSSGNDDGGSGRGCNASNTTLAPASGLIADFADPDGGIEIMGSLFDFGGGSMQVGAPTSTVEAGALHVVANTAATTAPQYVGVFLGFDSCIDASAFSGVKFTLSGSLTGCALLFFANDVAHFDETIPAPFATGPAGSYQPQYQLATSQISSTAQTVMVTFKGQSGGSPPTPLDPSTLVGLSIQLNIPAAAATPDAGAPACVADLTLDDVTFF